MEKFEEEYFKERNPGLEPKHEYEVRKWIRYFSLQPSDRVFVHGCGYGQRLHWFLTLGMNAWGMEVSEYAMKNAYGSTGGKIHSWLPSSEHSRGWYDLVVSVDVLEHINEDRLINTLIKLSKLSLKAVYGITYIDNHNFPKDPTHITGMAKQEWKDLLSRFYKKVYDAPRDWFESDMYLICYGIKK